MGILRRAGEILGITAALGGAAEAGTADMHEKTVGKESTPHVETVKSPERAFMMARQEVIDSMNESTFDMTSGGKLEGNGWDATVTQEKGGTIVAKISMDGTAKEYVIRVDEIDDGKGNLKTVYSMNTGIDRSEESALAAAQAAVEAAGDKGGSVAMNEK